MESNITITRPVYQHLEIENDLLNVKFFVCCKSLPHQFKGGNCSIWWDFKDLKSLDASLVKWFFSSQKKSSVSSKEEKLYSTQWMNPEWDAGWAVVHLTTRQKKYKQAAPWGPPLAQVGSPYSKKTIYIEMTLEEWAVKSCYQVSSSVFATMRIQSSITFGVTS